MEGLNITSAVLKVLFSNIQYSFQLTDVIGGHFFSLAVFVKVFLKKYLSSGHLVSRHSNKRTLCLPKIVNMAFLQTNYSHFFKPSIVRPTRVTPLSKTLIDNIFTNSLENINFSGNIISSISDHLPQYC